MDASWIRALALIIFWDGVLISIRYVRFTLSSCLDKIESKMGVAHAFASSSVLTVIIFG